MKPLFLIADDSATKRDFLKRFVQKQLDVEILEAATTEGAKKTICEHVEIAAAIVDFEIPSEQGPAVIRALKMHNPECMIALATSADSESYETRARAAGAEAFLCTSWRLDRLEETLNTLLAEWKVRIDNT